MVFKYKYTLKRKVSFAKEMHTEIPYKSITQTQFIRPQEPLYSGQVGSLDTGCEVGIHSG